MAGTAHGDGPTRDRARGRLRSASLLALVVVAVVAIAVTLTLLLTGGGDSATVRTAPRARPATVTTTPATPTPTAVPPTTSPTTPPPTAAGAAGELAPLTIAEPHPDGYVRELFGGDWTDDDHDCRDTRAEALTAQSRVAVTYTTASACTVATGEWVDPWSGTVDTSAQALDIDHTVPLANAWRSGAWTWTPAQRLAYANDLTDAGHLLAIPLGENRSKGDDGPEAWRPPARTAWCAYAQLWTSIKARWGLTATPAEWAALQDMATTC